MKPVKLKNFMRMHRARLDITQEELAGMVGVSRQTIHAIERGKSEPSVLLALRLARLFEMKVDELFRLIEE
ncbi:helix-turn-helix transcriptional regulator [bacterium]|nr:helix-turn-helix transcriptional regulator [bacterium]